VTVAQIVQVFRPISLYLDGARYCHSYNERRIGTRMQSTEWCHFRWPWVTLT